MQIRTLVLFLVVVSLPAMADDPGTAAIGRVIDDFHAAAAQGDKSRYLSHLTDDAVFMGTDEWERWPKQPDFVDYVGSRFKNGSGWNYRSVAREIRIADSGDMAWFDEVIFSEDSGRFRGTGVLVLQGDTWKIAHYAMSFLVFNENWQDVIELSKETRAMKERSSQEK